MSTLSKAINAEYREIVQRLELQGHLSMPFGEKLKSENMFSIRIIHAGNVRVFYVYGKNDLIYGIYGYVKTTRAIPIAELKQARKLARALKQMGLI